MSPSSRAANDLAAAVGFFTRLPARWTPHEGRSFAEALWAAPLAGALVGLLGAGAFWAADMLGLPQASAALLALAVTMLATGCLHEDGLCDTVDGFGGGRTRERRLEIMRDSRIGSFGAAALFVSLGLRWSALASLAGPIAVLAAMIAAHAASRALLPLFLKRVPPARPDGLGAGASAPGGPAVAAALALGALALLPLGLSRAVLATLALALAFAVMARLCASRIGGQTGDVCGALQQVCETAVLLAAAAALPF